jgi:hypothetical protein
MLDTYNPEFISTLLDTAGFEETINQTKPNCAKDCIEGGESKNGCIRVYNTIQSAMQKYNVISNPSNES